MSTSIRRSAPDLLVIGGGLGGVAATLTAGRLGLRVVLVERGDWLGGQLTTQGVPPDENRWIESHPASASYAELRNGIRDHYRRLYPLVPDRLADPFLNPGDGFVSRLCHEPRVAAAVIDEMLSPLIASGVVVVVRHSEAVALHRDGTRVVEVITRHRHSGVETTWTPRFVADATELGDLLELGGLEHVIGAESAADTGELHASAVADPLDQQAVTWCAALEYRQGEDHTIDRPDGYDRFASTVVPFWPGSQLSWRDVNPISLDERVRPLFEGAAADAEHGHARDLWHYRRVLSREAFEPGWPSGDVTLVNWPQNDQWSAPLLGVTPEERETALTDARNLTLSFVHWMQTDAPRYDGGTGYPGLRLRGDVLGTADGLAKEVYVREARRILPVRRVTEGDIGREMRGDGAGSTVVDDSAGIGFYRIDLHPSTSGRTYVDVDCFPFQIPLGALLPREGGNLLPAAKNIGTTHITNGAYRLHPVEWSIGEAVGALVATCLATGCEPVDVHSSPVRLADYQRLLTDRLGVRLKWPDDIRTTGDPKVTADRPVALR